MLGFAAGIMAAAIYWSMLAPAIQIAVDRNIIPWIPAAVGFLAGGIFLRILDRVLPHLQLDSPIDQAEGIKTSWQRTTLLTLAMALHNLPEGLAIGTKMADTVAPVAAAASTTELKIGTL